MTIDPILRRRAIILRCNDLQRNAADLYHTAVQAQMPDEILRSVAFLSCDIAAIHNRVKALDCPTDDARQP